jgi:hypothetical protein
MMVDPLLLIMAVLVLTLAAFTAGVLITVSIMASRPVRY